MGAADDKAKKAAKKAKLKAEAESLGISYEELKAQKKNKKANKARKREAEKLNADNTNADREQEQKRMRTWSGDFDGDKTNNTANGSSSDAQQPATKRLRTRSMDKAEDNAKIVASEKSQSTEEWRKLHNITVKGHGTNSSEKKFNKDPYIEFDDAPFNPTIQKTLKAAGFERPTLIQAQVSAIALYCISIVLCMIKVCVSEHILFVSHISFYLLTKLYISYFAIHIFPFHPQ